MNNNLTIRERKHLLRIKEMDCIVCGASGPSSAHHVLQHQQYLCLPLCHDCHQNPRLGIHGERYAWKLRKMNELLALNLLIERLVNER